MSETQAPSLDDGDQSDSSARSDVTLKADAAFKAPARRDRTTANAASPQYRARSWRECFDERLELASRSHTGHAYTAYCSRGVQTEASGRAGTLIVCHHGAGSSALTFGPLAQALKLEGSTADLLAVDCRGHGRTTAFGIETDFSLKSLGNELIDALGSYIDRHYPQDSVLPDVLLIGHSMGGCVVADLAAREPGTTIARDAATAASTVTERPRRISVLGTCVLDVVEGSALESIRHMRRLVSTRPRSFASLDHAIDWHIRMGIPRSPVSARLSVPALFQARDDPVCGADIAAVEFIANLESTATFWESWYDDLSGKFLSPYRRPTVVDADPRRAVLGSDSGSGGGIYLDTSRAVPILILAGTDRLDTALTVAQMRGSFQLCLAPQHVAEPSLADPGPVSSADDVPVLDASTPAPARIPAAAAVGSPVGHFVHEDAPIWTARTIESILRRYGGSLKAL